MSLFARFKERIAAYWYGTPVAETEDAIAVGQARARSVRSNGSGASRSLRRQNRDNRSVSPTVRTAEWVDNSSPSSSGRGGHHRKKAASPDPLKVKGSKVKKRNSNGSSAQASPSGKARTRNKGKGKAIDRDANENYDADLMDESEDSPSSSSTDRASNYSDEYVEDEENGEKGAEQLTEEEAAYEEEHARAAEDVPTIETELKRRAAILKQFQKKKLTEEELYLFTRLTMRGYEGLLPANWQMDFETLPETLFAPAEPLPGQEPLICSLSEKDFRASKALQNLMTLGTRIRDRTRTRQDPTDLLKREIDAFIKWSVQDAKVGGKEFIPNLFTSSTTATKSYKDVEAEVCQRYLELAALYRDELRIHPSCESDEDGNAPNTNPGQPQRAGLFGRFLQRNGDDAEKPEHEPTGINGTASGPTTPKPDSDGGRASSPVDSVDGTTTTPTPNEDGILNGHGSPAHHATASPSNTSDVSDLSEDLDANTHADPSTNNIDLSDHESVTPPDSLPDEYLCAPPHLYAILMSHTVCLLSSYHSDEDPDTTKARPLCLLDFGDPGQDVWNALAVAILAMMARNILVSLREDFGGTPTSGEDDEDL